jgi:hypothetical protein
VGLRFASARPWCSLALTKSQSTFVPRYLSRSTAQHSNKDQSPLDVIFDTLRLHAQLPICLKISKRSLVEQQCIRQLYHQQQRNSSPRRSVCTPKCRTNGVCSSLSIHLSIVHCVSLTTRPVLLATRRFDSFDQANKLNKAELGLHLLGNKPKVVGDNEGHHPVHLSASTHLLSMESTYACGAILT